jgi:hypothetical protein
MKLDWKLGDFWGNLTSFGFSNFHCTRFLGNWEIFGELENPNMSNLPKLHGNWKLENP